MKKEELIAELMKTEGNDIVFKTPTGEVYDIQYVIVNETGMIELQPDIPE